MIEDEHYCSQLYSGERFDYANPGANDYELRDIAHHLSMINRYGGAAVRPYSVAQHSINVADALWSVSGDPWLALDGLFHDAAEAYVGDMRSPLKARQPDFIKLENEIDKALRLYVRRVHRIPLYEKESPKTKQFDRRIVGDERLHLLNRSKFEWRDTGQPLGLRADAFRYMGWREARIKWLQAVESFTKIALQRS